MLFVAVPGGLASAGEEHLAGKLEAKAVPALLRKVRVVDQNGRAVGDTIVSAEAHLAMGTGKDVPVQTIRLKLRTDDEGILALKVPDGIAISYSLSISSAAQNGDCVDGKLDLGSAELAGQGQGAVVVWKVKRDAVILDVQVVWDKDYSEQPFDVDTVARMGAHMMRLSGAPREDGIIERNGRLRFFDAKPGKYELEFAQEIGRKTYRITRDSAKVEIPQDGPRPVKHTLVLMPIAWRSFSGKLVDADSGEPIAGAVVAAQSGTIRTDKNGVFAVKLAEGGNSSFRAEAQGYSPVEFKAGQSDNKELPEYRLKRYPEVSGTIVAQSTGLPMAGCSVEWEGGVSGSARSNEFGRFALRLAPGRYNVSISTWHKTGPGREDRHKVVLFRGEADVGPNGYKGEFTILPVTEIRLGLTVSEAAGKEGAPAFIWLLRAGDDRIMGGDRYSGAKPQSLYAIGGRYKVVVGVDEKRGAMVGVVEAGDKQVAEGSFEVKEWRNMVVDKTSAAVSFEKVADAQ